MMIVVDTNVAVVANGESPQASPNCVNICINRLKRIMGGEIKLVLDENRIILDEYSRNLYPNGNNVGDRFLKWCYRNRTNPEQCELVSITPAAHLENEFEEFPKDPELANFDLDDRKFVAVAHKHPEKPPILQAVDSQWLDFRDVLSRHGVTVEFICEDDIHRLRRAPRSEK